MTIDPQVYVEYAIDFSGNGYYTVGVSEPGKALGIEFCDDDGQNILHEKSHHATFSDAVSFIKGSCGTTYDTAVKDHAIVYTAELDKQRHKELRDLGWTPLEMFKQVQNFANTISSFNVDFDAYANEKDFQSLIEHVGSYYAIQKSNVLYTGSDGLQDYVKNKLANMIVSELDSFDTYEFNDQFDSKEEALDHVLGMLDDSHYIKEIFDSLNEDFEEIYGHESMYKPLCDMFDEISEKEDSREQLTTEDRHTLVDSELKVESDDSDDYIINSNSTLPGIFDV